MYGERKPEGDGGREHQHFEARALPLKATASQTQYRCSIHTIPSVRQCVGFAFDLSSFI